MAVVTGSLIADTGGGPPEVAEPLSGLVAGGAEVSLLGLPASATTGGLTGAASALAGGKAGVVSAEASLVGLPASTTTGGGGVTGAASALAGGKAGAVSVAAGGGDASGAAGGRTGPASGVARGGLLR